MPLAARWTFALGTVYCHTKNISRLKRMGDAQASSRASRRARQVQGLPARRLPPAPRSRPPAGRPQAARTLLPRLLLVCVNFLLRGPGGRACGWERRGRVPGPAPRAPAPASPPSARQRRAPGPGPSGSGFGPRLGLHPPLSGLFCGFGDPSGARLPFAPLPRLTPHPQLGPEGPGGEIRRRKPRNQVQGEKRETKGMDSPPPPTPTSVLGNNFQRLQGRGI